MFAHACSTICTRTLFFWAPFAIAKAYPNEPIYLGYLGLIQAIPALSLAILGGHFADRFDRRSLLRNAYALQWLCALGMSTSVFLEGPWMLTVLFVSMFFLGVARGFADPTMPSLEAQIVPRLAAISAATWTTIVWHACAVIAPLIAGTLIEFVGKLSTFATALICSSLAIVMISRITPKPIPEATQREPFVESITAGWKFVMRREILWTAMALDLFAVLFGGAIAMLPLYAEHILKTGPVGLGLLNAAPMLGALLSAIACIRIPPRAHAGKILLACIFGFGLCMITFSLSRSLVLSILALLLSGVLDGISIVIRKTILRLYSPDHMRGRVAAVNSVFIGASNELGELESGLAAHYLGLVPSVFIGGLVTLGVVVSVAVFGREIKGLDLRGDAIKKADE
jgi:MFS family permease